jgi:hypothetical protein
MPTISFDAPARVSSNLLGAEAALNEAIAKQSELLSSMLAARQHYAEPFLGQEALMRLLKAQQSLLAAGGDLARVHESLLKIGREKGAVIHDCPENKPMRRAREAQAYVSSESDGADTLLQKVVAFG